MSLRAGLLGKKNFKRLIELPTGLLSAMPPRRFMRRNADDAYRAERE
jgi:hypothetical protein